MKRCSYCLADIPSSARKCKYCGEWVDGAEAPAEGPDSFPPRPARKVLSRYNFGEKAFLFGLLSFCIPPLVVLAIGLGVAGLIRQNSGDSPGWSIAGVVLGGIALFAWVAYVGTMMILHSH
jgi:hypothetical protein